MPRIDPPGYCSCPVPVIRWLAMIENLRIAFWGTSRSGLGHLRRLSSIAQSLVRHAPDLKPTLITNAPPDGLAADDLARFSRIVVCPRRDMAQVLARSRTELAVLDTLQLPGMSEFRGQAVLILREMPEALVEGFRRDDGRPWNRVIVPNPQAHWMPGDDPQFARDIRAAGWILRPTGPRAPGTPPTGIVVATGGGGSEETRAHLYPLLNRLVAMTRARTRHPFLLRHAIGPRAGGAALEQADEVFDPGGDLNAVFRDADLVISTAGYNSVLELANTDTPALLTAIPRSLDDQAARARLWGPKLGHWLDPDSLEMAAAWLADRIDRPRRRPPVDLGPDGAVRTANLILECLCRAS